MTTNVKRQGGILFLTGLDSSIPAEYINESASPNNKNFLIDRGILSKRNGTTAFGATLSEEIMKGVEFIREGTRYNVRIGLDKIQRYNTGTSTWVDIHHTVLTGTTNDLIDVAIPLLAGKEILCITNGIDVIFKWTGSGNTAALGGTPPKAKYIQEFKTYLVCANITGGVDIAQRVQWSDTAAPETWTGGNSGSVDLVEEGDPITGLAPYGNFLAVHKRSAIYLGYLVSSTSVFRFDRLNTGVGAIGHNVIANIPSAAGATGQQVFLANDGLRILNGSTAPRIDDKINDEIRDGLNQAYAHKAWSLTVPERDEVWLALPIGDQTTPDTVYKYNYNLGILYKDERPNISAAWRALSSSSLTWDEMTGTWDDQSARWDDGSLEGSFPFVTLGGNTGITTIDDASATSDNGTAISSFYETKDFMDEEGRICRWQFMELWAKGNSVTIQISSDKGNTFQPVSGSPFTLTNFYPGDDNPLRIWFDSVSSEIRFKFINNNSGETLSIKKFIIGYKPREFRINA